MWIIVGDVPIWFDDNDDGPSLGDGLGDLGPKTYYFLMAMMALGIGYSAYLWFC